MNAIWRKVKAFLTAEDGPTSVEYAVMLVFIIVACFAAVEALGISTSENFTDPTLHNALEP